MTFEEHATAIRAALKAALSDGHRLSLDTSYVIDLWLDHGAMEVEDHPASGVYATLVENGKSVDG